MKKNLVIFTGAGISKESGIPTFRDSDGLWKSVPIDSVCTPEAFRRDPEGCHEFYNELKAEMLKKEPNSAHYDCALLEKYFNVTVVTQNVDNLHEKAGSTNIIKIHGDLTKVRSTANSNNIWTFLEPTSVDTKIEGQRVRPHIVFFGEDVLDFGKAKRAMKEADICIVIGTSLVVQPAASLIEYVPYGNPIYYIDPNPGEIPELCKGDTTIIQETATKGMKTVMGKLLNLVENNKFGDLFTLEEFKEMTDCGAIMEDDGDGYYSDGVVLLEDLDLWDDEPDERCTHVMWFNK